MVTPDNWAVIRIDNGTETLYKVLAGWSGGYTTGDSWRLNSGVSRMETDGDYYLFYGYSGSVYRCHKNCYMLRMNTAHVWEQMKQKFPSQVHLMDESTDWHTVDWSNRSVD